MQLEFDCGIVAPNVGELVMALRYHLTICEDVSCKKDVEENILKYGRRKLVTKRDSLKIDQPYLEISSGQYFFTPDNIGVYWHDLEEIRQDFPYAGIIEILELED
jgi:hypothetical protein